MDKNKLLILFKLSGKFFKRYLKEYFLLLLKPLLIGIIGILSVLLAFIDPIFGIVSLFISIPCICYSFWRGYLITYSLNLASYNFIKKNAVLSLENCYKAVLQDEKRFAMYVLFYALATIIGYIPTIIFTVISVGNTDLATIINNPFDIINTMLPVFIVSVINSLVLLPFLNFSLQAYTFKKDENFIQLFLNCYKKLDLTGFIIAFIVSGFSFVISAVNIVLYFLTFIFINLIVYSVNTFWYSSRIQTKEM